jgi:hypothetical protein
MSHIVATDLKDALLQPYAATYLSEVEAWIIERANDVDVDESDILATLGSRAKRAATYQLAIFICLGEGGQNQQAFGGDGKDAFAVKLSAYQKQQDALLPTLTAADWSGSTLSDAATPSNLCPEIFRA